MCVFYTQMVTSTTLIMITQFNVSGFLEVISRMCLHADICRKSKLTQQNKINKCVIENPIHFKD